MTLFKTPLRQTAIAGVAILTTALTFGAALAPAPAQALPSKGSSVYYRATLEQSVERRTEVIRGGTFICSDTICVGSKARSRPEVVCERLARKFGPVATFTFDGTELDADALANCRAAGADA
ncbi:hypothetical protein AAG612_12545 [Citromicrobium bathyomarinum]|uniref:CC_3452 family protein n=1 Tax=Citromicrobium bathyomarinum TaxID=72174 RepID=UPI00315A62E0